MQIKHLVAWTPTQARRFVLGYESEQPVVVHAYRGTGLSTALRERVHRDHEGLAIIVCPNTTLARIHARQYLEEYPDDLQPNFIAGTSVERGVHGSGQPIYVECWDHIPQYLQETLLYLGFRLAVNTSDERD